MRRPPVLALALAFVALVLAACGAPPVVPPSALPEPSAPSAEILAASTPADWRPLALEHTLVMEVAVPGRVVGPVIIELAPAFAPRHVDNVLALARAGYFDGLAIVRVQENYVVQWGDADGQKPLGDVPRTLPAEYEVPSAGLPFTPLPDGDVYAPAVGFTQGLPVGRDDATGRTWLAHCHGIVGVGRDEPPDTGSGHELYVVTGHAPRHLDRNMAMIGRIVQGIDTLTALPRGTGALGFYEQAEQRVPITRVRVAADLPVAERPRLEVMRTDTPRFADYVASRRFRREGFFALPTGRVELCNVAVPVRPVPPGSERVFP